MRVSRGVVISIVAAALAVSTTAAAGPGDPAFCAIANWGVPGLGGMPEPWWPAATTPAATPDDPRWVGASGHSLASGSATAPAELRAIWHDEGGQRYLYLSWEFYVAPANFLADHVLYLGFKTASDLRVVRFAFNATSSSNDLTYCNSVTPGACTNGYTVFATPDPVNTFECGDITDLGNAVKLSRLSSSPIPWITTTGRFWRSSWPPGSPSSTVDRWSVQLRIPIVAAPLADLSTGIAEGTEIAYLGALEKSDTSFAFGRWPRETAVADPDQLFCTFRSATNPQIIVADQTIFRPLSLTGSGSPAPAGGCSGNVKLDMMDIGLVDPLNPTGPLLYTLDTDGTPQVAARVTNNGTGSINANTITGRFRMANWGAQSWIGAFGDVPIGAPPAEAQNSSPIPGMGGKGEIHLAPWDLSEVQECQYTWETRTTAGWAANCSVCDDTGNPGPGDGVMARSGPDTTTCHPAKKQHQCFAVELRGGNVDFENRSMYNNLEFAPLSVHEEVAIIDVKGLPAAPGQQYHDVYFLVMPRNMPKAMAAKTYQQIFAETAAAMFQQVVPPPAPQPEEPSPNDEMRASTLALDKMRDRLPKKQFPVPDQMPDVEHLPPFLQERAVALAQVGALRENAPVEDAVLAIAGAFDGKAVAHLVPTLEVYAYYAVPGAQKADTPRTLAPLTSFTLVTHHDGPVEGFAWALDGAEHVEGNLYRTQVPVDGFRKIRVKVESQPPASLTHDASWPCTGGCCGGHTKNCPAASQLSNAGLGALALWWANRRRKKKS